MWGDLNSTRFSVSLRESIQYYFSRRAVSFHFLASLSCHNFSGGRLAESEMINQLCVLGVLSAAGGEII